MPFVTRVTHRTDHRADGDQQTNKGHNDERNESGQHQVSHCQYYSICNHNIQYLVPLGKYRARRCSP